MTEKATEKTLKLAIKNLLTLIATDVRRREKGLPVVDIEAHAIRIAASVGVSFSFMRDDVRLGRNAMQKGQQ